MYITFCLKFCTCPKVCGSIHCIIMWWLMLSKCVVCHGMYLKEIVLWLHERNHIEAIVTHETWVQTWIPIQVSLATCTIGAYSIGSLEATLSPFLEVIVFLVFVLSLISNLFLKPHFFHSKSWLWTWNTSQCVSSSCPFAQVIITLLHICIYI